MLERCSVAAASWPYATAAAPGQFAGFWDSTPTVQALQSWISFLCDDTCRALSGRPLVLSGHPGHCLRERQRSNSILDRGWPLTRT